MEYYSTNKQAPVASLKEAVVRGLADGRGLYMPGYINPLDEEVIANVKSQSFHGIACTVAQIFFGEDIEPEVLDGIIKDTLSFETPVVPVKDNIYGLELLRGPTLAFRDVEGHFMACLFGYFIKKEGLRQVNVLVTTSGDTGSAVANGLLGAPSIHVYTLYPKGEISPIQECRFTTLGQNIATLRIDSTFNDCQALVRSAFMDEELNRHMKLTSANSINMARFSPQSFYYFDTYARLDKLGKADELVAYMPSGNFGDTTAGLFAYWVGLLIKRFVATNNRNDMFLEYLNTRTYTPHPSVATLTSAMDVDNPNNFACIIDLFDAFNDLYKEICAPISGHRYTDKEVASTMRAAYKETGYILGPHGACGYQRLLDSDLNETETDLLLETVHPAKFEGTVDKILEAGIEIPVKLKVFMEGAKRSIELAEDFEGFKSFLMSR